MVAPSTIPRLTPHQPSDFEVIENITTLISLIGGVILFIFQILGMPCQPTLRFYVRDPEECQFDQLLGLVSGTFLVISGASVRCIVIHFDEPDDYTPQDQHFRRWSATFLGASLQYCGLALLLFTHASSGSEHQNMSGEKGIGCLLIMIGGAMGKQGCANHRLREGRDRVLTEDLDDMDSTQRELPWYQSHCGQTRLPAWAPDITGVLVVLVVTFLALFGIFRIFEPKRVDSIYEQYAPQFLFSCFVFIIAGLLYVCSARNYGRRIIREETTHVELQERTTPATVSDPITSDSV